MAFILPDLVIESVIRDGLEDLRRNPARIDNIFESLTQSYVADKYGVDELEKIKKYIDKKDIAVVHSFHEAAAKSPCYSIQLSNENEDLKTAHLDDFEEDEQITFTDPEDIANLVVITSVITSAYDLNTGAVTVDDSIDLSNVHANLLWVDDNGTEHQILGGIVNIAGQKQFLIAKGLTGVGVGSSGEIKSSLNYEQFEVRGVRTRTSLILGVHSKDALLTKYLYILLKYFLLSRKGDLVQRCFVNSTYQGSDFTRNLQYEGDIVFTRFLTVSGEIEDSWRSDEVTPVDLINTKVLVSKDEADDEDIGLTDATIGVTEDDS